MEESNPYRYDTLAFETSCQPTQRHLPVAVGRRVELLEPLGPSG